MTIINLLNKIANGEEVPNKIRYEDEEYYLTSDEETYIGCISHSAIGRRHCLEQCLTDEIEIIEEDKPIEKIMQLDTREISDCIRKIQYKVNEIIDKLNKLEEEKEK